jgi:hypothetical protein
VEAHAGQAAEDCSAQRRRHGGGGAVLWVFSTLLTAPVILAGLWIWSGEFVWARRLLHRFMGWLGRFWERVRRRPTKWTMLTALGVLSGAVAYWASHAFGLL